MNNKQETIEDYQSRIIRILVYIERHLDEELTLQDLAYEAAFSPHHFHRIFRAFVGEPLYAYIKRLRLDRAAMQLRSTHQAITDVSFQSGYDSPAAFSKAFRERFGITPSGFRQISRGNNGGSESDGFFSLTEKLMKPEIRQLSDQTVLFVRRTGNYNTAAAEAWNVLCSNPYAQKFFGRDTRFIGISHDDPMVTEAEKLRYDACATVAAGTAPNGELGVQIIAGGRYATFIHRGPYATLHKTYDQIFSRWLPESSLKLREIPCFELYLKDPERTKPEELETEIYIPVQ